MKESINLFVAISVFLLFSCSYTEIKKESIGSSGAYEEVSYNKEGKKHGVLRKYNKDALLLKGIPYKNGLMEGEEKSYYKDGSIRASTQYKNGKRDGVEKEYYKDGTLKKEAIFKNGKRSGISKSFFKNGYTKYESHYKNDNRILFRYFYEDGDLGGEQYYDEKGNKIKAPKKNGEIKTYKGKNLVSIINYKNDLKHGETKLFYDNGNVKTIASYKNGILEGKGTVYNEEENIIIEATWEAGVPTINNHYRYAPKNPSIIRNIGYFYYQMPHWYYPLPSHKEAYIGFPVRRYIFSPDPFLTPILFSSIA